jgi:hypothetical protein
MTVLRSVAPRLAALGLAALLLLPAATAGGAARTAREPAFGLPHIFADTDLELARENGREIAKDRLGQLILLARVGRGNLYQAFGVLDPSTLDDDIETRRTGYTSSELNDMWAKLPQAERDAVLEYCRGINDTIEQVYTGALPEPLEVNLLRTVLGLSTDLFGNATNISDQVDPFYLAPGGADPQHPTAGFQFTPEMAISIGILEVRNFGFENFDEPSRLAELQALIAQHGAGPGAEIWDDYRFLVDPLAPVTVPDPTTPGFGGPLAARTDTDQLVQVASRFPRYDYAGAMARLEAARTRRMEFARKIGAWPALGSYAWLISGAKTASGWPALGGFPQTGIQTPSIMHFAENRSAEGGANRIHGIGMEFAGAPFILIGQTDTVAYTTTTALLRIIDTFFEQVVNEDSDTLRYNDEGTPAPLTQRTETFRGIGTPTHVFWRSHARGGNAGSRAVVDFRGDAEGAVQSATATSLSRTGAFDAGFAGGHVALVDGPGAGQIRAVSTADANTLTLTNPWTTVPTTASVLVAVRPGNQIIATALDSPAFKEESTAVLGFSRYQRADSIMDVRAGVRLIPSTHNFFAADNLPFNGIGTAGGTGGNLGYWASGYSRKRQGGQDPRLPLDGTVPNPLVVRSGVVASATATSLTATGTPFSGDDFSPDPINFRYQNPTQQGSEYIVAITTGTGARQTRRIATNDASSLTVEAAWGITPAAGDSFEVSEVVGQPEAVNPAEGYTANWNNKQATADEADNFGREWRHIFILEQLAAENAWDRAKQEQLNADVAGLDGKGKLGRYLLPRIRQAVDAVGDGGNPAVNTVLAALEAHNAAPFLGRSFVDPVTASSRRGEVFFLNSLIDALGADIYGDEFAGTGIPAPTGARAFSIVQHAIDSAAGDLPGAYAQSYSGDYFDGVDWRQAVRDTFSARATIGIPADAPRGTSGDECRALIAINPGNSGCSRYRHPLAALNPALEFDPTPAGNRGTYEQIVDVGPVVNGEFIFPLGQSGLIAGSLAGVTIDPHVTSLHPIWRDWRFVPLLHVGEDLAAGDEDGDGDGAFDGYERWYFGDTSRGASDDSDGDGATLADEFQAGTDPTKADTDGDGIADGQDGVGQDRLESSVLSARGKIRYGDTPGTDRLKLKVEVGNGGTEFDPATRPITLTLRDDDEIYTVTIPAGTMTSGGGRVFTFRDAGGANNGLILARFKKRSPKPSLLIFRTGRIDLSAADQTDHQVTITVQFGAHTATGSSPYDFKGKVGEFVPAP